MADWADDRARAYFDTHHWVKESAEQLVPSLATLLMEVASGASEAEASKWIADESARNENVIATERARVLAEVRRVVEKTASDVRLACISTSESDAVGALRGAILSRLDKL